jgi:RNA polymerase subunit RPABC4/transcription elongation factor Spt4|tara:strand:- start:451 stop:654 length:204 start_codon:yes stop_codon:yes gene_type:complete
MDREERLSKIAERHECDEMAKYAMKKLRRDYDLSYTWCEDCDGVVVKERECCWNLHLPLDENDFELF